MEEKINFFENIVSIKRLILLSGANQLKKDYLLHDVNKLFSPIISLLCKCLNLRDLLSANIFLALQFYPLYHFVKDFFVSVEEIYRVMLQ